MGRFAILITGKTDPVPGAWHDPKDFEQLFIHEADRFPDSYEMKVLLGSEDLESDVLHTNAIPLAEFEYLKSHSVFELLELMRASIDPNLPEGQTRPWHPEVIEKAILMISALNAVKVVETK